MSELNINLSSPEIRRQGWHALMTQLGAAGTLKFMMEYNQGEGDYTKSRLEMFQKVTVKELMQDMKKEHFNRIPDATAYLRKNREQASYMLFSEHQRAKAESNIFLKIQAV